MTAHETVAESEPRLRFVQCLDPHGLHRMAYWEWGDPANDRVLVCVHGLSRQGRDFDVLARSMADRYRVVCPDIVGRGRSDRLVDASGYAITAYVADMVTLLARLDAAAVHWVGTSMGGLIGIGVASLPGSPVKRLVLNDVGPAIEPSAMHRIRQYLGKPARWQTLDEAADALWRISSSFGPHTRDQWLALTAPMLKAGEEADGGGFVLHYDPAIAEAVQAMTPPIALGGERLLWAAYDRIACPTLLLRGSESDLLAVRTAAEMTRRGPRARLHEFAGVGHAPTLVQPEQVNTVREFLLAP